MVLMKVGVVSKIFVCTLLAMDPLQEILHPGVAAIMERTEIRLQWILTCSGL